jgi:hypothetical protein
MRVTLHDGRSLGYAEYGDRTGNLFSLFLARPVRGCFTLLMGQRSHSVPGSLLWNAPALDFLTFSEGARFCSGRTT